MKQSLKGWAFMAAVAGGAASGGIATGTTDGVMWGAFSGAVFFGIGQTFAGSMKEGSGIWGSTFTEVELARATLAHGAAGGTISHLQGGKFGHGFVSAGVSKSFSTRIDGAFGGNTLAQGTATAIVGGTTSRLTGGKFANGAVTAAMAYAFNQAVTAEDRRNRARQLLIGEGETLDDLTPSLMRKPLGMLGDLFLERAQIVGGMSGEEFASYVNGKCVPSRDDQWQGYRDQHAVVLRAHGYRLSGGSLSRRLDALSMSALELGISGVAGKALRKGGAGLVSGVSPTSAPDLIMRSSANRVPILRSTDMNVHEIDWR
ncbi:MAG: hypothetical protein ACXIUM_13100 [Wenzhouxiangella sp.]